jgi:hypothetical protein
MNWLLAVQGLVFALLIPFRTLLVLASSHDEQELFSIYCSQIGLGHPENTFFILCAGLLCALAAFGYLHSAAQLDFYHSLAIRREKLFTVKLLASTLTFVIAYAGAQLLAILVGLLYGVASAKVIVELMAATVQGIISFLCSYAGALLAVMLTGKLLTSVLAIGVLGLYVPLLWVLNVSFREVFFQTMFGTDGVGMSRALLMRFSSPWAITLSQSFFGEDLVEGTTGIWPSMQYLLFLLAVAVVLFLICLLLYRIRRTEAAGQALAFGRTEGLVKLLLSIPCALLAAMIAHEMMYSVIWEILFILIFGTLACMIMEFIYRWDIRQALSHKLHIVLTVGIAAAIFLTFRLDLTGYDTYLPAKDQIASMAARYYYNEYHNLNENGQVTDGLYGSISKELLDQFETDDFDDFYQLAENGVANEKGEGNDRMRVSVGVKYHLKNGKEVYRCYNVDLDLFLEVFNHQKEQEGFTETYYPIMTWSDQTIAFITAAQCYLGLADESLQQLLQEWNQENQPAKETRASSSALTAQDETETEETGDYEEKDYEEYEENDIYTIPDEDIERLVEAYRKDLLTVSYEDCWNDAGIYLGFSLPSNDPYYVYDSYPVTEKFTNTIAVLADIVKDIQPDTVNG